MKCTLTVDRTTVTATKYGSAPTVVRHERVVSIAITDAPTAIETGTARRTWTYRPDRLTIYLDGRGVVYFRALGPIVKADGTPGARRQDARFRPDGRNMFYRSRPDAPAWVMEIVEAYR